jgi:membrane-associated phospholipid phosphatase
MTTKQHFVWDVVTGIIIGITAWKFWILPALENSQTQEILTEFESL